MGFRSRLPSWLVLLALTAAACAGDDRASSGSGQAGAGEPILVFAAADLQSALAEVADRYTGSGGTRPELVFGSTGNLATQIENGAPADLFFAANESFLDRLASAGLIVEESRRVYALGRLAVVWDSSVPPPSALADLTRSHFRTVAVANPEHAPYGMAAREALRAIGAWERVEPRLVLGENIAQTLQFVQTGNAQGGIVALGLVLGPRSRPHLVVPDSLHAPLRQAAAVLRAAPRAGEARRFLDFVSGAEGQRILGSYGFAPPDR